MKLQSAILFGLLCICFYIQCQQVDVPLRRISGQGNGGAILEFKPGMRDSILNSEQSFYPFPVYEPGNGPVNLQIYNSQICPNGLFSISVTGLDDTARWKLHSYALNTTLMSDSSIYSDYMHYFNDWGIQIISKPVENPGEFLNSPTNGFLSSKIIYGDSSQIWLNFFSDLEGNHPFNWIRSGHLMDYTYPQYSDWNMPSYCWDFYEVYENETNGIWSPYLMVASHSQATASPAYSILSKMMNDFQKLSSIDLIFTDDHTKWSRCVVIEMCDDTLISQGNAKTFSYRKHPSVNINGDTGVVNSDPFINSNYVHQEGMGWFPGYAINIETGERLNIIFGEDSWLSEENGRDMKFNPTGTITTPFSNPILGGKHYIYIMGAVSIDTFNFPRYDGCGYIHNLLSDDPEDNYKDFIYASAYWVGIPLKAPNSVWLNSDITIKLRVSKKYDFFKDEELPAYLFSNGINSVTKPTYNTFTFFPNPASNHINIDFSDVLAGKNVNISIFNSQGEMVLHNNYNNIKTRIELDVTKISCGLFFIIISSNNVVLVKKLIISR